MKFSVFRIFFLLLIIAVLVSENAFAQDEIYTDNDNKFVVALTKDWVKTHSLSPIIKLSAVSAVRAASGRPIASFKISVTEVDADISINKYLKNSINTSRSMWSTKSETSLDSIPQENKFLVLEQKIGHLVKTVNRLYVKANGNMFELSCSVSQPASTELIKACDDVINSFHIL